MNLPKIAICGALRSGKDAIATYLAERYGYVRFAFGDALKDDFHHRYPEIPREPKPRIGYQNHGQLMRALVGEDVWVSKCFAEIKRVSYGHIPIYPVISDLRQPNEYDRCRAEGYVIIRVTRPDSERLAAAAETDTFNPADLRHETEQHVDKFAVDYEIVNDGTLAELYTRVDEIITKINEKEAVG